MPDFRKVLADLADKEELPDEVAQPEDGRKSAPLWSLTLFALQFKSNIYGGTVPPEEVRRRRAKNRDARRARRGNTPALARQARLNRDHTPRFRRGQAPDPLGLRVDAEVGS